MKIWNSIDEYMAAGARSSVALGYFDGVHTGHRAVIDACCAGKGDGTAVVLTFRESPAAVLGLPTPPALTDNARKAQRIEAAGVDALIFADFAAVRGMSPEQFVQIVLKRQLGARRAVCGYNYRFGRGGAGDIAALQSLCAKEGIEAVVVPPVYLDGEAVSSTRIRALLAAGDIARANRMLGYRYAIAGVIGSGNRIGTELGFPTVNIPIGGGLCVPRYGVYASRVTVDGKCYGGATNIGVRPTVESGGAPLCETFLIGYDGGALYGRTAVCELLTFLRDERRFAGKEDLQEQVNRDISAIRKMMRE